MKKTLKNDTLLRALLNKPVDYTPVWIMRQAGRHLPEYRALREQTKDFMTFCKTPALASEATLQPIARYPLDAAIVFSDILTIPDAMGLGLQFVEGKGPVFERPIRSQHDIDKLGVCDPVESLGYVCDTIAMTRKALEGKVPLIGFAGSPWTLATYMVEGSSTRQFERIKGMMYCDPKQLHRLLDLLTQASIQYLNAQVEAGAQALMLFDSWGGILSTPDYHAFSLQYMTRIVEGLTREQDGEQIPLIVFTKGGGLWLESLANIHCDCIGLDWTVPLDQARARVPKSIALQGNLDPCALLGDEAAIEQAVRQLLADYGKGSGHVFNLGHGILPSVCPSKVAYLIEQVHTLSKRYH